MEIEDVITKMREDLKNAKKSDLIEMVIQSQLQVMDLAWSLDRSELDNKRLRAANSGRRYTSFGGVSIPC